MGPVRQTLRLRLHLRAMAARIACTGMHRTPLVLCYHAVSSDWGGPLVVSEAVLAEHVALLKSRGYAAFTFAELERRRRAGTLPRRAVAITFDDGFASVQRAVPILRDAGFSATVFVVTDFVESGEPLRWPGACQIPAERAEHGLGWGDLETMAQLGWEVGSHGAQHRRATELGDEELADELRRSKSAIAARFGTCLSHAYPYGIADSRVAAAAAAEGYVTACTLTRDHRIDDPFRRPRLGLLGTDVGLTAAIKLSRASILLRRTRLAHLTGERQELRRLTPARSANP